ncbi:hypothetical protein AGIG_G20231 [Arapaima gigas]
MSSAGALAAQTDCSERVTSAAQSARARDHRNTYHTAGPYGGDTESRGGPETPGPLRHRSCCNFSPKLGKEAPTALREILALRGRDTRDRSHERPTDRHVVRSGARESLTSCPPRCRTVPRGSRRCRRCASPRLASPTLPHRHSSAFYTARVHPTLEQPGS